MDPQIHQEIENLRRLGVVALRARYREVFKEESRSSNRAHLFRRLAWRIQARAAGDLSERARRRAADIADDAELRRRAPRAFWRALDAKSKEGIARDPRVPQVGSLLERTYQKRPIVVRVVEDGFEYNKKTYASLSAIASRVTGTRWNGFAFFGIDKGKRS
jgi:hypothetical protein